MSNIFFTVGPSQLYPTAKKHIEKAIQDDICSLSHRSKKFQEIYASAVQNVKNLLGIPENFQIFFLGSATEAMERIIQNCVREHSFHFVNGSFSKRFFDISGWLGKKPEKVEVKFGEGFYFNDINIPDESELICLTQTETSAGTSVPMKEIYSLKKRHPEKLIAVDIVSSVPYPKIDFSKIDAAFFSVQKGFGLPAGLGVLVVNEKCLEKSRLLEKDGISTGSYHNFSNLLKYAEKNQTSETPNVLGIYLMAKVAEDMLEYGINKIRKETEEKAERIYDFFENNRKMEPFVKNKKIRSQTIAVIETPGGSKEIVEKLKKKGITLGTGYKDFKEKQIRIANFPTHKISDVEFLLREIENL
jgi:phosphoserine aminotransferase